MRTFIFLGITLLFFFSAETEAQSHFQSVKSDKNCDTVSKKKFDRLVKSYHRTMKRNESVSVREIIDIVRIYISIPVTKYPQGKRIYIRFIDLYKEKYMAKACEMLNCEPLRGLVLYSKEYDLYLSFTKNPMACYNYFLIK